jgi:hypothetical protein
MVLPPLVIAHGEIIMAFSNFHDFCLKIDAIDSIIFFFVCNSSTSQLKITLCCWGLFYSMAIMHFMNIGYSQLS